MVSNLLSVKLSIKLAVINKEGFCVYWSGHSLLTSMSIADTYQTDIAILVYFLAENQVDIRVSAVLAFPMPFGVNVNIILGAG